MLKTKPIRHYFPNKEVAREMISKGIEKYKHSTKYFFNTDKPIPRGIFLGKLYIDAALAAIMYATGKEPKPYYLNTPSQTYGWSFDETRDILSALDGLSKGNDFYWNTIYGEEAKVILPLKKAI